MRLASECDMCDNGKMPGHDVCSNECGKKLIELNLENQRFYQKRADSYGREAERLRKIYGE